jgi:hypothetical protein
MAGKKYTSLAKSAPSQKTTAGVDVYKDFGSGGTKKSLPKGKKVKKGGM